MGNKNKAAFLGMPHGTANARLRKAILFKLVQTCKEDICFRCGLTIEKVDDLSIEHKLPWENISVELFWDLDNIAFSHLKCNKPHVYYGGSPKKKQGEEGTSWCCGHKEFLPKEKFSNNKSNHNGLQHYCKSCFEPFRKR